MKEFLIYCLKCIIIGFIIAVYCYCIYIIYCEIHIYLQFINLLKG